MARAAKIAATAAAFQEVGVDEMDFKWLGCFCAFSKAMKFLASSAVLHLSTIPCIHGQILLATLPQSTIVFFAIVLNMSRQN